MGNWFACAEHVFLVLCCCVAVHLCVFATVLLIFLLELALASRVHC
jgi:hypothetical protein